jgi:hypothetical protein
MKRTTLLFLITLPLLFSCHHKHGRVGDKNHQLINSKLIGLYFNGSGNNEISLMVLGVTTDSAIIDFSRPGDDRYFVAAVSQDDGVYTIQAPLSDLGANCGVLKFSLDTTKPNLVTGDWLPDTPTVDFTEKTYRLTRKAFVYSPAVGEYPEASERLLVDSDVNNYYKEELATMRNEIYARHGYCFKNDDVRMQFNEVLWYVPHSIDVRKELTSIEKKNIELIKRYEKNAKEDDDFGR